jgi:hypothetical protein
MKWQVDLVAQVAICFRLHRAKRPGKHFHDYMVVVVVVFLQFASSHLPL